MQLAGIDPLDLRHLVIAPALTAIGLGGDAAEELMLGTALQESGAGRRLVQVRGPARGLWQMEPATHDDIWQNFLATRTGLAITVHGLMISKMPLIDQLEGNLYYACAMARLVYYRRAGALPAAGDLPGQAAVYKAHYNTPAGAATEAEYIANWRAAFPETPA